MVDGEVVSVIAEGAMVIDSDSFAMLGEDLRSQL